MNAQGFPGPRSVPNPLCLEYALSLPRTWLSPALNAPLGLSLGLSPLKKAEFFEVPRSPSSLCVPRLNDLPTVVTPWLSVCPSC